MNLTASSVPCQAGDQNSGQNATQAADMPGDGLPAVVLSAGENPPNPDSIGGFVYKSLQRGEIRALNGGADSWWQNMKIDRDMLDGKQSELEAWKLAAQQNT